MHPWHKYRRAAGIVMSLIATLFMVSVLFLCQLQTVNLLRGETTCERFAKTNYKKLHALHQEALSMELSYDLAVKKRFSIMSIDDNTNPEGTFCGNPVGMCCNQHIMDQKEILTRTQEAYALTTIASCEGRSENTSVRDNYSSYRSTTQAATPLISKVQQETPGEE